MNPKNNYIKTLFFAIGYAVIITFLSVCFDQFPLFLKIENGVYDPLQRLWVINDADDQRVERFQTELNDIYCINLDSAFIDFESSRVRRDSLAKLLQALNKTENIQTIFLDYIFEPLDTTKEGKLINQDSILYESMIALAGRLVLLKDLGAASIFDENTRAPGNFSTGEKFPKPKTGALELELLRREDIYRFVNLRLKGENSPSLFQVWFEQLNDKNLYTLFEQSPPSIEINYLLNGDRPDGRRPALNTVDASDLLRQGNPENAFNPSNKKLIVIGGFDKLVNRYKLPFDSFKTPVAEELSGVYLNLNTYLNVFTQSYIRRSDWSMIFILNFLIGIGGAFYFHQVQRQIKKKFVKPGSWLVFEILITIIFFTGLIVGLFYWQYTKFPFVFTLLFFMWHQFIYAKITNRAKYELS